MSADSRTHTPIEILGLASLSMFEDFNANAIEFATISEEQASSSSEVQRLSPVELDEPERAREYVAIVLGIIARLSRLLPGALAGGAEVVWLRRSGAARTLRESSPAQGQGSRKNRGRLCLPGGAGNVCREGPAITSVTTATLAATPTLMTTRRVCLGSH
jgi:hypothetical protein